MLLIRDEKNIPKKFVLLLENREAKEYNLKINKKFNNSMSPNFWNILTKAYNKVEFIELDDDEIYVLEKINGEDTSI